MSNNFTFKRECLIPKSFGRVDASTQDRQVELFRLDWPKNLVEQLKTDGKDLAVFNSAVVLFDKLGKLNKGAGIAVDIYGPTGDLVGVVSQLKHTLTTQLSKKGLTVTGMVDIEHTSPIWGASKRKKIKIEPVFWMIRPIHEHRKPEIYDLLAFKIVKE